MINAESSNMETEEATCEKGDNRESLKILTNYESQP